MCNHSGAIAVLQIRLRIDLYVMECNVHMCLVVAASNAAGTEPQRAQRLGRASINLSVAGIIVTVVIVVIAVAIDASAAAAADDDDDSCKIHKNGTCYSYRTYVGPYGTCYYTA